MSVASRLFRIVKAVLESKTGEHRDSFFPGRDRFNSGGKDGQFFYETTAKEKESGKGHPYHWDPSNDLSEDLKIFNLSVGATWDEIKKGYRGECRKYHSDLYHNAPDKKDAAEEIMVIYNSAYARLKRHYQKK